MNPNVVVLGYLIASVCFILALRSLSSPTTAWQSTIIGGAGMMIAVIATLFHLPNAGVVSYVMILLALAIGGAIGLTVAGKIDLAAMPRLVTASCALVGMATVLISAALLISPRDLGIADSAGRLHDARLFEIGLASIIGAITSCGSVIAFGRLQGTMASAPMALPMRHWLGIGLGVLIFLLLIIFMATGSQVAFSLLTLLAFAFGWLLVMPIGDADMPLVVSMLNGYAGFAVAAVGFALDNPIVIIAGALVGSSGAVLTSNMCRAMNRSLISALLGGFVEHGKAAAKEKTGKTAELEARKTQPSS